MRRFLVVLLGLLLLGGACASPPPPPGAETVVLVHGLGRTRMSMALLGRRLAGAGYRVVNVGYPSTREPMEQLVEVLRARLEECCTEFERVHFVTHSMGGILVRRYLAESSPEHQGRVVMLSPPSRGSEVIDAFADSPLLRRLLGPAGMGLGTDTASIPNRLGPAHFQLGVITGNRSFNPINSWLIPGPDDGKVAVDRARVEGAAFLVVPSTHPFIMSRKYVADEVVSFLRTGRFTRTEPPDTAGAD
jgi:pimeloyl-ACP methyl ester carboxylesterase